MTENQRDILQVIFASLPIEDYKEVHAVWENTKSTPQKPNFIFIPRCFANGAKHFTQYKHWAKMVDTVDMTKKGGTKKGGFMFEGEWMDTRTPLKTLEKEDNIILEYCGCFPINRIQVRRISEHVNVEKQFSKFEDAANFILTNCELG